MPSEEKEQLQLLQGMFDLIVLRTLATMGAQHAYQIATRLQQVSEDLLNLNQGTLYPPSSGWNSMGGSRARGEERRPTGKRSSIPLPKPGKKLSTKRRCAGAGWPGWWNGCWWRNPSREVSQTFSYQVHRLVS